MPHRPCSGGGVVGRAPVRRQNAGHVRAVLVYRRAVALIGYAQEGFQQVPVDRLAFRQAPVQVREAVRVDGVVLRSRVLLSGLV